MARIELVDQTLRDGQQSLWGMRMRAGHALAVADAIDGAGYRVVDLTGSSPFEVMVRYRREDPWKGLDAVRAAFPHSPLRAGTRTNGVVGMGITPDAIIALWVQTLAEHGIRSLWIFDCLHDVPNMLRVAQIAREAGIDPSPQLMFTESPVHTDEHFAEIAGAMAEGGAAHTILLGDEAGVLGPERARRLLRQLVAAAADVPLEAHFHNKTAMANYNHIVAVEEGVRILHCAVSTMANGVSMPSTEMTVDNMRRLGHDVVIDDSRVGEVAEHFGLLADEEGFERGAPVEYSVAAIQQQFPGGMMGTLREQLRQVDMLDRLGEVLEEAVLVREEMGWPIMATPFSQLVGIQALLNVVQRERYRTIPDENLMYLCGWHGTPPGPVSPDVLERVSSTERGRTIAARGGPPQPSLQEIRARFPARMSDEELLLRVLMAGSDVDAMYAAKRPIVPIRPWATGELGWLRDVVSDTRAKRVSATYGDVTVDLARR